MDETTNERICVQSLVGGTHIDFYIKCLLSLVTQSKDPIQLLLHSDGSLSPKDEIKILEKLRHTNVSFLNPSETKENTLDQLEGRPNCQKFEKSPFGEMNSLILYFLNHKIISVFTSMLILCLSDLLLDYLKGI